MVKAGRWRNLVALGNWWRKRSKRRRLGCEGERRYRTLISLLDLLATMRRVVNYHSSWARQQHVELFDASGIRVVDPKKKDQMLASAVFEKLKNFARCLSQGGAIPLVLEHLKARAPETDLNTILNRFVYGSSDINVLRLPFFLLGRFH
ncbi:hypothetical protein F511_16431 [Dorcoceras hygrometricum]|uniref:Uncharacterized protein n=1 Tax=Dorcoceras hygrometricum TaxID=472368 RepID=A0A2Z7AF76_9LAMI|nr:hypothetical protein F511_16431 [Dorcoceras hygrometricum]